MYRIDRHLLLFWFSLLLNKSQGQYYFYRTKIDAGLIVGCDFSRLNLTSYHQIDQKQIGKSIPYCHLGGYVNFPWVDNLVFSTEVMYGTYGLNYRYNRNMSTLPPGINYDLNRERIQYLINNNWIRSKYGRFAIQGGIKFSYLVKSSGDSKNLVWFRPHNDLYRRFHVRIILGAEYEFLRGAIAAYFHTQLPVFSGKNILSADAENNAFPNMTAMRLFDLQLGTKLRIGK